MEHDMDWFLDVLWTDETRFSVNGNLTHKTDAYVRDMRRIENAQVWMEEISSWSKGNNVVQDHNILSSLVLLHVEIQGAYSLNSFCDRWTMLPF